MKQLDIDIEQIADLARDIDHLSHPSADKFKLVMPANRLFKAQQSISVVIRRLLYAAAQVEEPAE
jgi:hypothetical protein